MIKLMIVGRRRGGMTVDQLHRYMVDEHGAAVLRGIASHPHETPRRYVQNHVFDASFRVSDAAAPDPFAVARDFVTQVWFDSPEQAHAAQHSRLYLDALQPDEDRFVDQSSVVKLAVAERPVFGRRHEGDAFKVFVFHRLAPGATAAELDAATLALWQPLLADADLGIGALVRNEVRGGPGGPPTVDRVDEAWLRDEAGARRVGERWQALSGGAELASLLVPGSAFVLLARERVMFAGSASAQR